MRLNWEDWDRLEASEHGVVIEINDELVDAYRKLVTWGWVIEKELRRPAGDRAVWAAWFNITDAGRAALALRQKRIKAVWAELMSPAR